MTLARGKAFTLACALAALLVCERGAAAQQVDNLSKSDDVALLEKVAGPSAAPELEPADVRRPGSVKHWRREAYVRLGNLGSPESLAALKRVEARWREVNASASTYGPEVWAHPAGHFGDSEAGPLVTATDSTGVTYAIMAGTMLGSLDLYLTTTSRTPDNKNSWTKPLLIPRPIYRGVSDPKLVFVDKETLRFTFTQGEPGPRGLMEGQLTPVPASPKLGRLVWNLSLQELRRDSDGDGLTDIEEQRLGLDPVRADTDGDGLVDGRDACPDFAPPASKAGDEEEAQIIQRAFLAMYGLTGSRQLLFVEPETKRVQLWGYAGPILYRANLARFRKKYPEGYVIVSWAVKKKKGEDEAVVSLSDYEGPLAASGRDLKLKKVGGEWFVVESMGGWIS